MRAFFSAAILAALTTTVFAQRAPLPLCPATLGFDLPSVRTTAFDVPQVPFVQDTCTGCEWRVIGDVKNPNNENSGTITLHQEQTTSWVTSQNPGSDVIVKEFDAAGVNGTCKFGTGEPPPCVKENSCYTLVKVTFHVPDPYTKMRVVWYNGAGGGGQGGTSTQERDVDENNECFMWFDFWGTYCPDSSGNFDYFKWDEDAWQVWDGNEWTSLTDPPSVEWVNSCAECVGTYQ